MISHFWNAPQDIRDEAAQGMGNRFIERNIDARAPGEPVRYHLSPSTNTNHPLALEYVALFGAASGSEDSPTVMTSTVRSP